MLGIGFLSQLQGLGSKPRAGTMRIENFILCNGLLPSVFVSMSTLRKRGNSVTLCCVEFSKLQKRKAPHTTKSNK